MKASAKQRSKDAGDSTKRQNRGVVDSTITARARAEESHRTDRKSGDVGNVLLFVPLQ